MMVDRLNAALGTRYLFDSGEWDIAPDQAPLVLVRNWLTEVAQRVVRP